MVKNFEEANGVKVPYVIKPRRAGDIATCYSNADKAKKTTYEQLCADSASAYAARNPHNRKEQ